MRRLLLAALGAGLFVTACRLFVDTDGLSGSSAAEDGGGSSPADGGDGSTTVPPAPPPPPGSDASTDAATDSGTDAASTFCATWDASIFCDSFDDGTFNAWSGFDKTNGGVVEIGTTNPKSAPSYAHAYFDAGDAGRQATAGLYRLVAMPHATLTYAADVRVVQNPTSSTPELLEVFDEGAPSFWAAYVALANDGALEFGEEYGNAYKGTPLNLSLGIGVWRRLTIALDFANKTFAVSVDNQTVTGTLAGPRSSVTLRLTSGISWCDKPDTSAIIDMDNVTAGD